MKLHVGGVAGPTGHPSKHALRFPDTTLGLYYVPDCVSVQVLRSGPRMLEQLVVRPIVIAGSMTVQRCCFLCVT